jgi:uncharacterized protein YggT (Ycf19 family)
MIVTAVVWGLAHPGLVQLGIVPPAVSNGRLWQQALLLGVTSYCVWKWLLLALCILFLVNSYVYMGRSHFWTYVNTTGANLLRPLRRFPICIGKLDLSPVVGIGLVFGISHGARLWLPRLFQHLAS